METVKVKPWGKGQGDYVLINTNDFDPKVHEHYDPDLKKSEDKEKPSKPPK